MEEEFNLKTEREKLFQIVLKQKPTAGRVYRIVRLQDKEFIKRLRVDLKSNTCRCDDCINCTLDKLAGDKLT